MSNPSKQKGTKWENDSVELLNKDFPKVWKRVPMSGAIGTALGEPELASDIKGKYPFIPFKFVGEAKVGYGGKNMTIRKEWFDKIRETADRVYGVPVVVLKFLGARSGIRHVIATDFETWNRLMSYIEELEDERNSLQNLPES